MPSGTISAFCFPIINDGQYFKLLIVRYAQEIPSDLKERLERCERKEGAMGGKTGSFLSDASGAAPERHPSNEWEGGENVLREKVNLPSDPLRSEPRQAVRNSSYRSTLEESWEMLQRQSILNRGKNEESIKFTPPQKHRGRKRQKEQRRRKRKTKE